jgi:hypothetical protein
MRKELHIVLLGLGIISAALHACKHQPDVIPPDDPFNGGNGGGGGGGGGDDEITCDPDSIYYVQDVLPIVLRTCALPNPNNPNLTCHHAGHEDGLNFNVFSIFQEEALDGEIYDVLTDNDPDDHMPPPGEVQLTPQEMNTIFAWIQQGAQYNSCESCDTTNVTYAQAIEPLIANNCAGGCHAGATPSGGLDLMNYPVLHQVATDGRLEGAINHLPGFTPMPFSTVQPPLKLSQCKIDKIMNWIAQGAPNN